MPEGLDPELASAVEALGANLTTLYNLVRLFSHDTHEDPTITEHQIQLLLLQEFDGDAWEARAPAQPSSGVRAAQLALRDPYGVPQVRTLLEQQRTRRGITAPLTQQQADRLLQQALRQLVEQSGGDE